MRRIGREVTRKSDRPTAAQGSRQRLREFELSGDLICLKPETIALPKCRIIRHDSYPAALYSFPLAKTEMITVKLRAFGFLAVVLAGLFFSSCAVTPRRAAVSGAAELGITQDIIPPGNCGRPLHRPMRPTFITIHSTDNTSRSANALNHALAMNKGLRGSHNRTGFLTWHFTVDDHSIYQTLPTNETGEHADYEGPGNRSSIGIEMCVNRGNNLEITIDRTAQLTASLMRQYNIPLDHVVPHMHWRMIRYSDHRDLGFKQCPRLLLDGGRLGPKWSAFIAKVSFYAR
jgi:N-acetylmuramoyl-L-alanine amidase